jgi:hypothetical protein
MSTLSPREIFLLDQACRPLEVAFGKWSVYLVGTAAQERSKHIPRDVDVRAIMRDKKFDNLVKAIGHNGIAVLGITVGQYLHSLTGLQIDFQVQRQTEANALHSGVRNPMGHRTMENFKGDAQAVAPVLDQMRPLG